MSGGGDVVAGGDTVGREEHVKIPRGVLGRLAIWTFELTASHVPSAANVEQIH